MCRYSGTAAMLANWQCRVLLGRLPMTSGGGAAVGGPAGVSTLVNWYVGKVGYFLVGCQVRRVGRVGPAGVPRSGKSPELGAA